MIFALAQAPNSHFKECEKLCQAHGRFQRETLRKALGMNNPGISLSRGRNSGEMMELPGIFSFLVEVVRR
jgi:hypothetical protein